MSTLRVCQSSRPAGPRSQAPFSFRYERGATALGASL
jgi:hypothetical protein